MRNFWMAALAAAALLGSSGVATAADGGSLSRAVSMCRAEIAQRAGVDANQVEFASVRMRSGVYRVIFNLTRESGREAVRCNVSRGSDMQIASLTPDFAPRAEAQSTAATP